MLGKQNFIVAFLFNNKTEKERAIRAADSTEQNEDFGFCVARERGQEINVCNKLGILNAIFTDDDFVGIEKLSGRTVLLRGNVQLVTKFRERAKDLGIEFLIEGSVLNWPKKIVTRFNKRKISAVKYEETTNSNNLKFPIFIKTLHHTNFGDTGSKMSFILKDKNEYLNDYLTSTMHLTEQFPMIVSDFMDIKEDSFGKKEYRCWISNQYVSSISRYLDYETNYIVPKDIVDYALDFANSHKHLPMCYVLDIAETSNGVDIVELNNLESSGRYGKNSFEKFLEFVVR